MKTQISRWVLTLFGIVTVPLFYNACQNLGGLFSVGQSSQSCKLGMQNGKPVDIRSASRLPESPFARAKVALQGIGPGLGAKGPVRVPSGSRLSVIMDNQCLKNSTKAPTVLSKASEGSALVLDRQAYAWQADRDYDETEIAQIAENESCVLGVSWNQEYKLQSLTFNDPSYFVQDYAFTVNAGSAYDLFYAAKGGIKMSGTPVLFATVDTGVDYTHPDINADMWPQLGVDVPTLSTSSVSYNPMDISGIGHGTHVSGMMAATSNNGIGIVGLMPIRGQIMGVKIFQSDGQGGLSTTSQYFYNGVQWAYQHGANVINLSVGSINQGPNSDPLALQALTEAVQHGSVAVVVIGNADSGNGVLIDNVNESSIPGQYSTIDGVIGVGSFDVATGEKSYFSHYSTTYAEIGAPGAVQGTQGLFSTVPVNLSSYARLAGTSQAAPVVSAAAGLTIAIIRDAYGTIPTPKEVERLIETSAIKSSVLAPYFKNGNRLDYLSLIRQINADYPLTGNGQTTKVCP